MNNVLKNLLLIAVTLVSTFACASDDVPFSVAKNYFVKNTYPDRNLHMLKITTEEKFNDIFGMAALMGENGQPTPIDFSKSFVIALIDNTSNQSSGIEVNSLKRTNGNLSLNYQILRTETPSSAYFRYCTILIVDKKYEGRVRANHTPVNGMPMMGSDLDDTGCKPSTGHSWSILLNECVSPWETKYVFEGEVKNTPLIISKNNDKAEIMASTNFPDNLILTKTLNTNSWVNGKLVLTEVGKDSFVLKRDNKVIGKAKLRNNN